jgi:ADP-ribosyl-[dinitrogen reductase] hydrolase
VILNSARARKEARKHAQEGNFDIAGDVLNQAANDLRDFSLRSSDPQRLEREADALDGFSTGIGGGKFDVAMSKSIHYSAQHLWQRRLRGTDELDQLLATRSDGPITDLRSRAHGVLLGVAVGNALGLAFEGRSAAEIAARYPNGWRDVTPRKAELPFDDDVAQTVALAESLVADPFFNAEDFAQRLVEWARTNGRGIGVLTQEVIDELASGTPVGRAARAVWERRGGSAAGNGAVMRFSPVALVHHSDPTLLLLAARGQAAVTHHDPRCIWSTVAVTSALALVVRDIPVDLPGVAQALDQAGAPREVVEAIMAVPGAPLESFELDDPEAMGYAVKAMQVGLWCLEREPDFEKVLVQVVRAGGDTDTNGAVAGAFMGARVGEAGIPRRRLANIPNPDQLRVLADALVLKRSEELE